MLFFLVHVLLLVGHLILLLGYQRLQRTVLPLLWSLALPAPVLSHLISVNCSLGTFTYVINFSELYKIYKAFLEGLDWFQFHKVPISSKS